MMPMTSYQGPAGYVHDMSASFNQDNTNIVSDESSGTSETMDDLYFGDEYNDIAPYMQAFPPPEWNQDMNLGLGDNGVAYNNSFLAGDNNQDYSNSGYELGSTPCNSAGFVTHQDPQLRSSNGSVHVNSAGLSRTDDQNAEYSGHGVGRPAVNSSEWDGYLSFCEEGVDGTQSFYTPSDSSHDDESERRGVAEAALPPKQEKTSAYPEEITAGGAIKPYHMNDHPTGLYVGQSVGPTKSNLYSDPHPAQHHLMNNQGASSVASLQGSQGRGQGHMNNHRQGDMNNHRQNSMNSRPQGFMNNYPQRQGLNSASYQAQQVLQPAYLNHGPPRQLLPATENGFGGPALVRQPLQQYDGSLMSPHRVAPNANGFGGSGLLGHNHGAVVLDNVVDPEAPVGSHVVVDAKATVDYENDGFIPLFFDEDEFNNRKAAREAMRVRSDYPYGNLPAQHKILSRLYKAIRNTTDVEDSEKVAAKFADNSIPDSAIHEACWEVMIHCRESQELKLLVPEYHHTKYLVKKSFTERIESAIATLHNSKAACKQAMAPSFLDRLADQPDEEMKRKTSNKILNKRKTGQNKAGQRAIERNCADANGEWKGLPGADASAQAEPQGAGEPGRVRRKREEDDEVGAPAPKRARH